MKDSLPSLLCFKVFCKHLSVICSILLPVPGPGPAPGFLEASRPGSRLPVNMLPGRSLVVRNGDWQVVRV